MSAALTGSRSQQQTPGASAMQTPGSGLNNPSSQLGGGGMPGTALRGTLSSQPTPATLRRPDLGPHHYVGFRMPPASAGRRSSLAPSVSQGGREGARRPGAAAMGSRDVSSQPPAC